MPYSQSLKNSYSDRLGWFFTSLSQGINTFIHHRKADPLAATIENFRGFVAENHPAKVEQADRFWLGGSQHSTSTRICHR